MRVVRPLSSARVDHLAAAHDIALPTCNREVWIGRELDCRGLRITCYVCAVTLASILDARRWRPPR